MKITLWKITTIFNSASNIVHSQYSNSVQRFPLDNEQKPPKFFLNSFHMFNYSFKKMYQHSATCFCKLTMYNDLFGQLFLAMNNNTQFKRLMGRVLQFEEKKQTVYLYTNTDLQRFRLIESSKGPVAILKISLCLSFTYSVFVILLEQSTYLRRCVFFLTESNILLRILLSLFQFSAKCYGSKFQRVRFNIKCKKRYS